MISINSLIDGYIDSEACLRMKFSCTGTEQALFPEEQQQGDPVGNVGGKFGRQHRPVDETSAVFQPRPVGQQFCPSVGRFVTGGGRESPRQHHIAPPVRQQPQQQSRIGCKLRFRQIDAFVGVILLQITDPESPAGFARVESVYAHPHEKAAGGVWIPEQKSVEGPGGQFYADLPGDTPLSAGWSTQTQRQTQGRANDDSFHVLFDFKPVERPGVYDLRIFYGERQMPSAVFFVYLHDEGLFIRNSDFTESVNGS